MDDEADRPTGGIMVVDAKRQYLEEVTPPVARYGLKSGKARVLWKQPFTIQLAPGIHHCPRPPKPDARRPVEVIRVERQDTMNAFANVNPAQRASAYAEYFKSCHDEMVWVKAVQPPGVQGIIQHAMTIVDGGNHYKVPPITVGDPVLMTTYAPFDVIRKSSDFRVSVMKGILQLMTNEEADAHFRRRAGVVGKTPEQLRAEQQTREQEYMNHEPLKDAQKPTHPNERALDSLASAVRAAHTKSDEPVLAEETVKPYIMHLCQQVNPMLEESKCWPAKELLGKLSEVESSLTVDDLEYVYAHGRYKSVKQWAEQRKATVEQSFEIDDTRPAPSPARAPGVTSI